MRGFDSRPCAYVLNFARARFGGPAWLAAPGPVPVRRSRPGPLPVRRSGSGPVRLAGGGKGGIYIQLSGDYTGRVKPLRRGWPGSGLVRLACLAMPFSSTGTTAPRQRPPVLVRLLAWLVYAGRVRRWSRWSRPGGSGSPGPAWLLVHAPGVGPGPVSVRLSWPGAVLWSGSGVGPGGAGRAGPALGPARLLVMVRLPVRRGHFRKQPRFFRPLHRAENFQRFFRRGILCARSKS